MSDDDLNAKAQNLETEGKQRYGEHWNRAIGAIGRAIPPNSGVSAADVVKGALRQADPAAALFEAGKEVLIAEASDGNTDSERAYSAWRAHAREEHLRSRGRMR
jgi:hypothetical protein